MAKLLVVGGAIDDEDDVHHFAQTINTGICHWLRPLPLHTQEEIRSILNSLKSVKSIPNRNADSGSVVSRFKGRILDTTILINPTLESLYHEIVDLLCTASPDCLIVYGGFVSEGEADWILQDGLFVFEHILHAISDSKVLSSISDQKIKLAISCPKIGLWSNTEMSSTNENIHLEIIDSGRKGQDEAESEDEENNLYSFESFLEQNILNEIHIIFTTLPPPSKEGFMKIPSPCIYIFPGGYGDSAFFAIPGFNMLVNGGSTSEPRFWKVVKHMDRVDSILVTHLGVDNLPGINSFLMRKLQEREINLPIDSTSEEYKELNRCLISPNLGPMFINAPLQYLESLTNSSPSVEEVGDSAAPDESDELIFKASDVIEETIRLSKALDLKMTPLHRKSASHEPIMLFSKFGYGKLDMYVLNPVEGSEELNYMNEKYGVEGHYKIPVGKSGVLDESGQERTMSYANLCSIAVLLVWHPSDPNEKISKIFDGLDRISDLPFMKVQYATANIVRAMKEVPKVNAASSSQKPPRPASGTAKSSTANKKFAPTIGKKAGGSSNSLTKDSVSAHSKISDRRAKNEKPAATKTKTVTTSTGKSAISKDKPTAAKASRGTSSQVSTRSAPASSATKRTAAPSSKCDMKRPVSKTGPKVRPTDKTTEKSKKPTAAVQKAKVDAAKPTAKKSPRQGMKKTASKPISNKGTKVAKESPQTSPSSRKTDSLVDVSQTSAKLDATPKSGADVCMDEPNEIVLSERRSPDGGDGPSAPCTFGNVPGSSEVQSLGNGGVKSNVDCDNLHLVMNKLCMSEESDMISTDGASAVSAQPTPIGDSVSTPDVAKFEEYISSDKSTQDEEQGGGDSGGKELPDTITSKKDSSEMAVEPMDQPVIHCHEASDKTALSKDVEAEDAVISPNVITINTTATAVMQDNDNCHIEAVEQKEFQSDEHAENIVVNNQLVDSGTSLLSEVTGSDIPASSSVEGSYELCSTGKSPLLASTQETIAETISDFKLDESVAAAEEEPTADLQLHHTEAAEEHTTSTDAFDAHDDISGVLTPSVVARVDPPFSSSDASQSTKDLAAGQELAQDIVMVQEDANQYETEWEGIKKSENFALVNEIAGDGESSMPAVVDSVPWNDPERQHVDPEEISSNDTMHLGGADIEVEKIVSLSEKELLHQDEKDDVSGDESTENSDVGDAGNLSEKQLHPKSSETDDLAIAKCSGIVDAADGHEKRFPEENEKGPISVPEVFEYPGENDVMDSSDKLFPDTGEKESIYILDDSECFGAVRPAEPSREFLGQDEKESVSIPETFDYSDTGDDENVPRNESLDRNEQDCASVPETSKCFIAGDPAEPPMESQDQKEKECGSIPETFDYSDTGDNENVPRNESLDRNEQDCASVPETSECFIAGDAAEPPMESRDQKETECGSILEAFTYSDSCDAENIPEKEFVDEIQQKSAAVSETFEYFGAQDVEERPTVLSDQNEKESVSISKAFHCSGSCENVLKSDAADAGSVIDKEFPDPIEEGSSSMPETSEYSDEDNTDESSRKESLDQSEEFVPGMYHSERMSPLSDHFESMSDKPESCGFIKVSSDDELDAARAIATNLDVDKASPDKEKAYPIIQRGYPIDEVSTDTNVLNVNVDQGETKNFDSPLNASAVPFIPATMQTEQLKSNNEQLGDEHGVTDTKQGIATATPPALTNPFLLDMLTDCPSTQVEPEDLFLPPERDQDPCAGQDKFGKATIKKSSQARKPASSHVYVDLAYVPNHGDKASVGPEFFKKIRTRCYVVTGSQLSKDKPTMDVFDDLLQGIKSWLSEPGKNAGQEDSSVRVIPTHDTPSVQKWFDRNAQELKKYNVEIVARGSHVVMEDEIIEACKLEF